LMRAIGLLPFVDRQDSTPKRTSGTIAMDTIIFGRRPVPTPVRSLG
jgi:hypothetical protein